MFCCQLLLFLLNLIHMPKETYIKVQLIKQPLYPLQNIAMETVVKKIFPLAKYRLRASAKLRM